MGRKYTYEEVKKYIESNSNCKLIDKKYYNCKQKILLQCYCGSNFKTTFDEFKNGNKRQCNECGYENGSNKTRKTQYQFESEVNTLTNGEYEVLGKYINDSTKIKIKHILCGNEWEVEPSSFIQGSRCPICQHRSYIKTTDEFNKEMYNLVGKEYEALEEYKGGEVKILVRHNKCGHEYYVKPNNFRHGRRCPKCSLPNNPKTEKHIAELLKTINISFKRQKTFDDCINPNTGKKLKFDFAIYNDDQSLFCLLEYDGKQHFEPIKYFGGDKSLSETKFRDNIKNNYCRQNNIKLIRIPYWDFSNLEDILQKQLKAVIKVG